MEGKRSVSEAPMSPTGSPGPELLDKNPSSSRSVASKNSRGSNHSSKSHRRRRNSLKASSTQRRKSAGETDLDQMILEYQAAARQELEQSFSQYVTIPPLPAATRAVTTTMSGRSSPGPGGRRRSHSHQRRISLSEKQQYQSAGASMDVSSSNHRKERRRSRRSSDTNVVGPVGSTTTRGTSSPGISSKKQIIHHVPSLPTLRPL